MPPPPPPPEILVVDDDASTTQPLAMALLRRGYQVTVARSRAEAESALTSGITPMPHLILLELILPDSDGLLLLSNIKSRYGTPIIVCTATVRRNDVTIALRLGADDYVSKPFDIDELEARMRVVLARVPARSRPAAREDHLADPLVIDRWRRTVTLNGEAVQLTPTELRLLDALLARPNEVLDRRELAKEMWGYRNIDAGRLIDVHVRRLRAKLGSHPGAVLPIVSIRGTGYKIILAPGVSAGSANAGGLHGVTA